MPVLGKQRLLLRFFLFFVVALPDVVMPVYGAIPWAYLQILYINMDVCVIIVF